MADRTTSRLGTIAGCIALAAVLSMGCSAASRYEVLSTVFDGVPPPEPAAAAAAPGEAPVQGRAARLISHGPYAAKLCSACHESAASAALVLPRDQLCGQCHELKLDRKYVHGPLASGGCAVCHDPHSSPNRALLVSASDGFCFDCHDRQRVEASSTHPKTDASCTSCHDAHMSDNPYLLR